MVLTFFLNFNVSVFSDPHSPTEAAHTISHLRPAAQSPHTSRKRETALSSHVSTVLSSPFTSKPELAVYQSASESPPSSSRRSPTCTNATTAPNITTLDTTTTTLPIPSSAVSLDLRPTPIFAPPVGLSTDFLVEEITSGARKRSYPTLNSLASPLASPTNTQPSHTGTSASGSTWVASGLSTTPPGSSTFPTQSAPGRTTSGTTLRTALGSPVMSTRSTKAGPGGTDTKSVSALAADSINTTSFQPSKSSSSPSSTPTFPTSSSENREGGVGAWLGTSTIGSSRVMASSTGAWGTSRFPNGSVPPGWPTSNSEPIGGTSSSKTLTQPSTSEWSTLSMSVSSVPRFPSSSGSQATLSSTSGQPRSTSATVSSSLHSDGSTSSTMMRSEDRQSSQACESLTPTSVSQWSSLSSSLQSVFSSSTQRPSSLTRRSSSDSTTWSSTSSTSRSTSQYSSLPGSGSTSSPSTWGTETETSSDASSVTSTVFTSSPSGVKVGSSASLTGSSSTSGPTVTSTSTSSLSVTGGSPSSTTSSERSETSTSQVSTSTIESSSVPSTSTFSLGTSSSSPTTSPSSSLNSSTLVTTSTTSTAAQTSSPSSTSSSSILSVPASASATSTSTPSSTATTTASVPGPSSGLPVSISISVSMSLPLPTIGSSGSSSPTTGATSFSSTDNTIPTTVTTTDSTSSTNATTTTTTSTSNTTSGTTTTDSSTSSTSTSSTTTTTSLTTSTTSTTSITTSTASTPTTTTSTPSSSPSTTSRRPPLSTSSGEMATVSATVTDTATDTIIKTQPQQTTTALETVTTVRITTQKGRPTTVTAVTVVPSGSLNPDNGDRSHSTLSRGTIAAISLVSVFAVATAIIWLFFAMRRRRRRQEQRDLARIAGRRSFDYGTGSLAGFAAGRLGRGVRRNSSGEPIRTAPLEGEDAEFEHRGSPGVEEMLEVGEMINRRASVGGVGLALGGNDRDENEVGSATRLRGGISRVPQDEEGAIEGREVSPRRFSYDQFSSEAIPTGTSYPFLPEEAALANAAFAAQRRRSSVPSIYSTGAANPVSVQTLYPHVSTEGRRASFSITPYGHSGPGDRSSVVTFAQPSGRPSSVGSPVSSRPGSRGSQSGVMLAPDGTADSDSRRLSSVRHRSQGSSSSNVRRHSFIPPPPPPSAWATGDKGKEKAKAAEVESAAVTTGATLSTEALDRARTHSSVDVSSSSNSHGGNVPITSSQGHGSATGSGSGSNDRHSQSHEFSSESVSAAHSGESSRNRSKNRIRPGDPEKDGRESSGVLFRTSLSGLRSRLLRSSDSLSSKTKAPTPKLPPQPVSTLQPLHPPKRSSTSISLPASPTSPFDVSHSKSHPNLAQLQYLRSAGLRPSGPIYGLVAPGPGEPPINLPLPRPSASLTRSQTPGQIPNFPPPLAPSALLRAQGPGTGLSVIEATPSDSPAHTGEGFTATPDGLLDPGLATRLRQLRNDQASLSSLGLRDNEDYSRPIGGLIKNRQGSSTTLSSHYSQKAEGGEDGKNEDKAVL